VNSDQPRVLVVQHTSTSGPGRLPGWLADDGIDAVVVDGPKLRTQLASGDPLHGLVLLGGGLMPDDDERYPFLPWERGLVGAAVATGVPVLGICLGAQMLALVAGGVVTANSGETERGSCRVDLLPAANDDSLFAGLTGYDGLRMIQNHYDSITALPPDAVHLATSELCGIQAFRVGAAAWGVQFHPEVSASRVAEWDESKLAAEGFDRTALLAKADEDAPVNTEQSRALIAAFAGVVREADR
jgi:GMP synthase (glutamine-hydrolysing)